MDGYILIVDLLGFSNIVKNIPDSGLPARIDEWVSLTQRAASNASVEKVSMLSDTVFAAAEASEDGLKSLISMARIMLNDGIKLSLPVKGAITYGQFNWGNLTYGKAVIDAHELESHQNWVGISSACLMPHTKACWGYDSLILYPIPKKSGKVRLGPVVSWDIPIYETLVNSILRKGLAKDGEYLNWPWADRINNTMAFSLYKQILVKTSGPPHKFQVTSPMQIIEMNIK